LEHNVNDLITTSTCVACRLSGVAVKLPNPIQYPDAIAEPVCTECTPLHPLELGAAALTDPTPAERARAESVWRSLLDPGAPCRCSGQGKDADGKPTQCHHGTPCDEDCDGGILHVDRYAVGLISSPDWWMDEYACSDCTNFYAIELQLPDIPWGVMQHNDRGDFSGYELYEGIRHGQFNTSDDEDE
jgi:hypothetical protein